MPSHSSTKWSGQTKTQTPFRNFSGSSFWIQTSYQVLGEFVLTATYLINRFLSKFSLINHPMKFCMVTLPLMLICNLLVVYHMLLFHSLSETSSNLESSLLYFWDMLLVRRHTNFSISSPIPFSIIEMFHLLNTFSFHLFSFTIFFSFDDPFFSLLWSFTHFFFSSSYCFLFICTISTKVY